MLFIVRCLLLVVCCLLFAVRCWLEKMARFQELIVYQLSEKLANTLWSIVQDWDYFAKDTVGQQIIRSADSIGANIAEGNGRYNSKDNQRFVKIARGSLNET